MRTSIRKLSLTHATAVLYSAFVCITFIFFTQRKYTYTRNTLPQITTLNIIQHNVNTSPQNTHKYYCISSHAQHMCCISITIVFSQIIKLTNKKPNIVL